MNCDFFFLLIFGHFVCFSFAYYGDPINGGFDIESVFRGALVNVENSLYYLGGRILVEGKVYTSNRVLVYNFTSNNTLQEHVSAYNPYPVCYDCKGYLLPDNKTIAIMGEEYKDTGAGILLRLRFFDTTDMAWLPVDPSFNNSLLPITRNFYTSAISPKGDAIYLIGGRPNYTEPFSDIIRFDLVNQTSIANLAIENPSLSISLSGASAEMLPNGVVVIAFGFREFGDLYQTNEVLLFDTNTNVITIQPINGITPKPRTFAASTLGPDKTTIYYFGGQDEHNLKNTYAGEVYNDLIILDTNTWSWVSLQVTGVTPASSVHSSMAVYDQNKIFLSTGKAFNFYSTMPSVLINVPGPEKSIGSADLRWFTNSDKFDRPEYNKKLSDGAIAGIIVGVLVFVFIITVLLWRYVPATKRILTYIQEDLIWNPRYGEPLWAETSRLLVRFILLVLFLSFVAYVIYRSIDSPIVSQEIIEKTSSVRIPDIRFCFDGFNHTIGLPYVSCIFRNGTSCTHKINQLDNRKHSPIYYNRFGDVSCLMFNPGPDFHIIDDNIGYTDSTGTKVQFSFFAEPLYPGNINWGVVYVDFYAPDYNPNSKLQGLTNTSKLSEEDIKKWEYTEQSSNIVESILLKQGVISTAEYSLININTLRRDDGWNYIGFSSTYEDKMIVETFYKDSPQSNMTIFQDILTNMSFVSQLTVQPKGFVITTRKDQKVFTLLNAFAQAGGVLGLFMAVQAILFGFRPQSPWGIVHRWSFGRLRIKLTDRLANYFNRMGTPVPLVNPVSTRISDINGRGHFNNSEDTYIPYGPDVPSAVEEGAEQENRMHRMEERLQLMEVLLKSYYLNDEIFKSLDVAVKRGRDERRRSSLGISRDKDTDSVLQNDALSREFEGVSSRSLDGDSSVSPTTFQMQPRGVYQSNLTSQGPLELYNDDHEVGKN